MKRTTKILSLILSVVTLLSVFSVATPVFAMEVTEATSESTENTEDNTVSEEVETEEATKAEIISEIKEDRTEYTKYFRMSDGSYMAAQYAQPVHYKENGEWKEYDYSITKNENTNENEFLIENSDSEMSFPEEFSEDNETQIEVSTKDYKIKFSPVVEKKIFNKKSKAKVKNHKHLKSNEIIEEFSGEALIEESADKNAEKLKIDNQKSAIAYEDVYNNIDIEYEISSNQIKESIVLNSKQDKNKFEFAVDTDGLFPKKEADGSITLYEDKEYIKAVSSIMKPYMYDANGEYSYDVTMDIKEKNGTYILTVEASNNWLNDKQRNYPVVIDPTIVLDVGRLKTYDCYVDNSQASTSFPFDYYIYAGYNSYGKTRTFIKFDLPELPDNCSVITNARIHFWQKDVDMGDGSAGYLNIHNVTKNWANDRTVTWNAQPTYDSTVLDYCQFKSGANAEYIFDITKSVKAWYEGSANYGLMLKSADESKAKRTRLFSAENTGTNTYPRIIVEYRNNKGIEDYWSFSSYSNDTAGATYINDYTGNLVYTLPILSSVSEIMPLTLSAVFNNYCASVRLCAGKNGSSKTSPGRGFRLNIQQTVLPSTQYGLTGVAAENWPFVYTDGDGTEHYIQKTTEDGATVYKDEDGLGLILTTNDSGGYLYRIKDKGGNLWYFNDQGNLYCQKDSNNNGIWIYFKTANPSAYDNNQMIDYVVDGAGRKFTFNYYTDSSGVSNGYIESITDSANRTVNFTTSSGLLKKITYPDDTYTEINYEGDGSEGLINFVRGFNGYALNFDYTSKETGRQVSSVTANTSVKGQVVTFDRSAYNKTVVRTAGMDGFHYKDDNTKGADDIITTIQFDDSGKPISQQVSFGSGVEIGAGNCSYTSGASTLGSANKISTSSSLGKNTVNLLYNNGAEKSENWTGATINKTATQTMVTEQKYFGKKSFKLSNSAINDANGGSYYKQLVSGLTGGKTYTFSAYVKVTAINSIKSSDIAGASLALVSYGSANNNTVFSSEKITKVTDTKINNGWRRLSVTTTLPSDATGVYAFLELRSVTGTAYFDGLQLETGSVANSCNLLENSSFEKHTSNKPTSWTEHEVFTVTTNSSGTVIDGSSANGHKDGSRALRIDGDALKIKGMFQTIPIESDENDTYIVSGWGAANAVNDTCHDGNSSFEIIPRVYYTRKDSNGNTSTVYQNKDAAEFNTTISGWQYTSISFALKYTNPASGYTYTPNYITVIPVYACQENAAYFDHIQLIKDEAQTHTYTYDKDGNVILTAVNSEQKVNTKYNDRDDLTSYTDTAGYTTTATYDTRHNLLTTKSARGIITKNNYYENGIINTSELQNPAGTASIKTEQAIDTENNGAIVSAVYDQHGYETSFTIHPETGVITDIITPNNVVTYNEYDDSYSKLSRVTTVGTNIDYFYNGNRLNKLIFSGIDGKSENYSFIYDSYGNKSQTKVGNQVLATNIYGTNNGALLNVKYGNEDQKTNNYNNLGLVSTVKKTNVEINENGNKTSTEKICYSWGYDASGRTTYHKDAENDLMYLYNYDSLGRIVRQEIQTRSTSAHIGSTEIAYDIRNNVTKVASEFGGFTATDEYFYSKDSGNVDAEYYSRDNLISRYKINGSSTKYVDYFYDSLNRLNKKSLTIGNSTINSDYSYYTAKIYNKDLSDKKYKTTQLAREILDNTAYTYYYDIVGNITEIKKSERSTPDTMSAYRSYTYDEKNQLLSETISKKDNNNNTITTKTEFTYDDLGNISNKTITDSDGTPTVIEYNYGKDANAGWNHILKSVNLNGDNEISENEKIKYDAIGNPTNYLGANLSWYGRELTNYTKGSTSVAYTYDADGLRVTKIHNNVKSTYHYVSGLLRYETRGNLKFYYSYDASGNLSAIRYYDNSNAMHEYFVLTNQQGDVVALYDNNGTCVVTYEYDAWGNVINKTDITGINFAELNPIRYRGYYYDSETGLYYLQSRYYNPQVGRFISADGVEYIGTGVNILCFNMFIYCCNNPIKYTDPTGCAPEWWQWTISGLMFVGGIALILTGVGTFAGPTFICAGVNSIIGSYISEASGGSSFAGWIGGIVLGTFSGLGMGYAGELYLAATELIGVSALNKLFTCLNIGFISGFAGAFASEFSSAKIDNRPISKNVAAYSAGMGLVTMIGGMFSGAGPMLSTIGSTSVALVNVLNAVGTLLSETVCDVLGGIASMLL